MTNVGNEFSFINRAGLNPSTFTTIKIRSFGAGVVMFLHGSNRVGVRTCGTRRFVATSRLGGHVNRTETVGRQLHFSLVHRAGQVSGRRLRLFRCGLTGCVCRLGTRTGLGGRVSGTRTLIAGFHGRGPPRGTAQRRIRR